MRLLAALLLSTLLATPAAAQSALFPARSGESGLLDVPDAEVVGVGQAALATELRLDGRRSEIDFGPLPLYATGGVTSRIELGLSLRDGGQPGDPVPARMLFSGALKLRLFDGSGVLPSLAADAYVDRVNGSELGGGRLIASLRPTTALRAAAFVGDELGSDAGLVYGGALSVAIADTALVVEALSGPRGANYGAAVRRRLWTNVPVSLGFNYFPGDEAFRVSLGFAFTPAKKPDVASATEKGPSPTTTPVPQPPTGPRFADDRPHFRLRLHPPDPLGAEPRSLRHGAWTGVAVATAGAAPGQTLSAPGIRPSAPSLEDLADAQLREQEALADARERRVRATKDQLDSREKAGAEEAKRLEERERELAAREQLLDARQQRIVFRGPPTQQQRQLESVEAQLTSQERNLAAQERSFGPALDAARGRERDAAAREDAERQEASRLAASVSAATSRALQQELRKQALAARNRQLAALEARLVATGERIDALERQLRTKSERLDAVQRRLDARAERLDLLERISAEPKEPPAAPAKPAETKGGAPKDKAVFVMVVKSPTAILRERAATASPTPATSLHAGVAVEKAVAAATVIMFPTPATQLSELDREAIDNIAKLAARERCELLIWARAKDPGVMLEAQRRAGEIRTRVIASGPLDEKQVVTRITTRPGAQGVDVVVSALRETAKAAPAPAAGPAPQSLLTGESGKRQIREAVQSAQPSIEACVGETIVRKNLQRAEGVLKLNVSQQGRVTKVLTGDGDLSGAALDDCLGAASASWRFPAAEAEYVVDVPITVIRGGAR